LDPLEERVVLSTINWVNEGQASDNFAAVFGSRASLARGVVDAAILSWEQVVTNFNQPGGGNTINVTISMGGAGTGWGGGTNVTSFNGSFLQGWPTAANISIGSGPNGDGSGYFLDPTPSDWSEFRGNIVTPYSGLAQAGSPAAGKLDLYTVVLHELGHALGFGAYTRLQTTGYATDTGVLASPGQPGLGYLWVFDGPSVTHLTTSDDAGVKDAGGPQHTAYYNQVVTWQGQPLQGADDLMIPGPNWSERYLIPDYVALMLHDAYNYTIVSPADVPTFYAGLDQTSNVGNLLIRGGDSLDGDIITLSTHSANGVTFIDVSVTIGDPVPGTAPDPTYTQSFLASTVSSITIDPGNGSGDVVNIESTLKGIPVTVNLGTGVSTVNISPSAELLDNIQGNVTVSGGNSADLLNVYDYNDRHQDTYSITSSAVSRTGSATIAYSTVGQLNLDGGKADLSLFGGDVYNVESTASGSTTTIGSGGYKSDTFNVSPTAKNLDTIQGSLSILAHYQGNSFIDTSNIYDQNHSAKSTYSLSSSTITRSGAATITYGSQANVNLDGGSGNDSYNIESTHFGTALTVQGSSGKDTFNISPTAQNLDNIQGNVTVEDKVGTNALNAYDGNNAKTVTYSVTSSTVTRTGAATISYSSINNLVLKGGSGNDTYNINGTAAGIKLALDAGKGNDGFNVIGTDATSSVSVDGGLGTNGLVGPNVSETWNITGWNAGNLGNVTFSNVQNLTGGTANDTFVMGMNGGLLGSINGGGGNDTLVGPNIGRNWYVTGTNSGAIASTNFTSIANLTGGSGDDTFQFFNNASVTGTIDGGGGTNELFYAMYATGVNVNLALGTATGAASIAHFQDVTGSRYNDHLTGGAAACVLAGNGGTDVLVGGTGDATFVMAATQGAGTTVTGGAGVNTLDGANIANTWALTGANAGNLNGIAFTGVANVGGGSNTDTFKFAAAGSISGKVDGGGGTNTLDYSGDGGLAATVNLATAAATRTGGFAHIQSLVGSTSAADLLIGPNTTNTWSITAGNGGTVGSFSFSGVENLTGGSANDTFKFSNGKGVTGTVDGGGGTNTLDYSLYTTGVTVDLTAGTATGTGGIANIENVTGSPANDSITGNLASNVIVGNGGTDVLNGGGGGSDLFILGSTQAAATTVTGAGTTDTLQGANIVNTWTISGSNAGNVNGIAFTGIANLAGGTSTDTFKFTSAGALTGKVDGGGGTNTLDYSGDGGIAATVNLAMSTATKTGGFAHIQNLVGSTSAADKLIGPNSNSTWTLIGANAGTVASLSFYAVENLTGGTGSDTFKFTSAGSISGKVDGGGGTNTLDYSGDGGMAATVNLASDTATKTGGFAHIQTLVGSTASTDKLIGPNATNVWSITNNNAGTVGSFSFSAIKYLTGGSGEDVFVFGAGKTISGKIDGGGGTNWLDYAAYTTAVAVNLDPATNSATGIYGGLAEGIANIRNVRGGQGGNTLTGNALGNILIGGAGTLTINGGTGWSILIADKGAGHINGGSGTDILIGGTTSYDLSSLANDLALEDILAEWQSGNIYQTRISNIKQGLGKTLGHKLRWGYEVLDNKAADVLTAFPTPNPPKSLLVGDWFFMGAADTIKNKETYEVID
jgi:hypothetical protein